jgi:hypothetical protein
MLVFSATARCQGGHRSRCLRLVANRQIAKSPNRPGSSWHLGTREYCSRSWIFLSPCHRRHRVRSEGRHCHHDTTCPTPDSGDDSKQLTEPIVREDTGRIKTLNGISKFIDLRIQRFDHFSIERLVFTPMATRLKKLGERWAHEFRKCKKAISITGPLIADQADRIPVFINPITRTGHRNQSCVGLNPSKTNRVMVNVRPPMLLQLIPAANIS